MMSKARRILYRELGVYAEITLRMISWFLDYANAATRDWPSCIIMKRCSAGDRYKVVYVHTNAVHLAATAAAERCDIECNLQ